MRAIATGLASAQGEERMGVHIAFTCTLLVCGSLVPKSAAAGLYADELAKCLVESTTVEDRSSLVKWMFAAMASHPEVKSMASLTAEQEEELIAGVARLFERLLTQSCRSQAKAAVEFEGQATLEGSFSVLGQVAARGLFADPDVAAFNARLDNHIDAEKLKATLGIQ